MLVFDVTPLPSNDFLINNTGNGQVGVSWDSQEFSAVVGPGQTIERGHRA